MSDTPKSLKQQGWLQILKWGDTISNQIIFRNQFYLHHISDFLQEFDFADSQILRVSLGFNLTDRQICLVNICLVNIQYKFCIFNFWMLFQVITCSSSVHRVLFFLFLRGVWFFINIFLLFYIILCLNRWLTAATAVLFLF